jgi:hypothetical protein
MDLKALIDGGELDRQTIENLRRADPEEMRKLLSKYLDDEEVERILARVRELVAAAGDTDV